MILRVLTLNVWALWGPLSRDRKPRMRAIGEAFARLAPDAVALQEVWDAAAREVLLAAGERGGLVHRWHHASALRGSGLVVLSRWPIRAAKLHRFELAGVAEAIDEADWLGGKGFVEVVLDTPRGAVSLLNTHLQAAYTAREQDPYVALRVGQTLQLAAHLRGIERPLILAGDMNFTEGQLEHRLLTGLAGVRDLAATLEARQATVLASNPYRAGEHEERIDYVFCRHGGGRRLLPRSIARVLDEPLALDGHSGRHSDHAGLLAELALEPGAAALPPPPDDQAVLAARALLSAGRAEALGRQRRQRGHAAVGLAGAPVAWLAARRPALSRRHFSRTLALGVAALAGGFGLARLALTECLRPAELAGFDAALARLDALGEGG